MNTVNLRNLRGIMIVLSVVIGVASTIATGGGSGWNSIDVPVNTGPTLAITINNGEDVSSAIVVALGVSFDLGDLTGDDLISKAAGDSLNLSGLKSLRPFYLKLASPVTEAAEGCANGGTENIGELLEQLKVLTIFESPTARYDNTGLG